MKIAEMAEKDIVTAGAEEKISKILPIMAERGIHQIPVTENKKFLGMIFLRDIVLEDMDMTNTNVKTLMRKNIPSIEVSGSPTEALKLILGAGVRALPVTENSRLLGIISETDMLSMVKSEIRAEDVMSEPITIDENESIGKAKHIMREKNISRLPVTGEKGMLVGVIDTTDLIKIFAPKERQKKSIGGPGESVNFLKNPVKSIMRRALPLRKDSGTEEIVSALRTREEIIVSDGKNIWGIITPKDVLEVLLHGEEKSSIRISNIERDDVLSKTIIQEGIEKWIKKTGMPVDYIYVYVHMHHSNGRIKYSLNMRLRNPMGLFIVKSVEWDLMSCVQELVKKAQRVIDKKHGKIMDKRRKVL